MDVVTITKLHDGASNVIIHIYLKSNGSGELTKQVLLDPTVDLTPPANRLTLDELLFNFAGFDATVSFDTGEVEPGLMWLLPEGSPNHADFRPFGGLCDRSGLDGTGKLLLSTLGFDDANDRVLLS